MSSSIYSSNQQYRRQQEVAALAERVVSLIDRGDSNSFVSAEQLLIDFFHADTQSVGRAYELACMVAIKRLQARMDFEKSREALRPFADWMAMRASREAMEGKLQESFRHLRISVKAGARQVICRKVIRQLLAQLPEEDRGCVIIYRRKSVVSIEVGRLCEVGIMILSGNEQNNRTRGSLQRNQINNERFFLRDKGELTQDQMSGRLQSERTANTALSLDSLDWRKYYEALCNEQSIRVSEAA